MRPGEVVLVPARSGGSFDPLGLRAQDVNRADDVVAIVRAIKGRWFFGTLTVDRSGFIGPEAAYQAADDRVKRLVSKIGSHSIRCFEVQTKTGDGWPHWHYLVRVDDATLTVEQIRALVDRHWRTEHISTDEATGEKTRSFVRIGAPQAQHVEEVRDLTAAATYVSKYLTKPWEAVPAWLGESTGRPHKLRLSDSCYDVLERLGRHVRKRGSRKPPSGRRLRVRPLWQRMACSGSTLNAMWLDPSSGKVRWIGALPAHADDLGLIMQRYNGRALQLGPIARCRVGIPLAEWRRARAQQGEWEYRQRRYLAASLARVTCAWGEMQGRGDGPSFLPRELLPTVLPAPPRDQDKADRHGGGTACDEEPPTFVKRHDSAAWLAVRRPTC